MDNWETSAGDQSRADRAEWNKLAEKPCVSSQLEMEIADIRAKLAPPSQEEAIAELTRCLRLTAPVGMSDKDRLEWCLIAYDEIKDIPTCEFSERCRHARRVADHPAKIVPAIFACKVGFANASFWAGQLATAKARLENVHRKMLPAPDGQDYCTPEQAAKIREEYGFGPVSAPNLKTNRKGQKFRMPTDEELSELARSTQP